MWACPPPSASRGGSDQAATTTSSGARRTFGKGVGAGVGVAAGAGPGRGGGGGGGGAATGPAERQASARPRAPASRAARATVRQGWTGAGGMAGRGEYIPGPRRQVYNRPPMSELSGRAILLTGASQGIGRALALELASRRARLMLAARDLPALEQVAALCRERGAEARAVRCDVAEQAQCRAA